MYIYIHIYIYKYKHKARGPYGPGAIWAGGQMGRGPYGPGAINANAVSAPVVFSQHASPHFALFESLSQCVSWIWGCIVLLILEQKLMNVRPRAP